MRKTYLIPIFLSCILSGSLLAAPQAHAEEEAQLKAQVQALQNRVDQLESQLAADKQAPAAAPVMYDQWVDPFAQMAWMQQQMDRNMRLTDTPIFNPRTDIRQTKDKYIITMDIPGMDKDKINVETKQDMLVISGERRSENEDKNAANKYYRQERSFGSFMQAIPLPDDARKDQINANYNNGVLTVTVGRLSQQEKKAENQKIMVR